MAPAGATILPAEAGFFAGEDEDDDGGNRYYMLLEHREPRHPATPFFHDFAPFTVAISFTEQWGWGPGAFRRVAHQPRRLFPVMGRFKSPSGALEETVRKTGPVFVREYSGGLGGGGGGPHLRGRDPPSGLLAAA